jgi:hypothetical protein
MNEELRTLEAGEYTLVARFDTGKYRGALWHGGRIVQQVEGSSLDEVYRKLEGLLYERQAAIAAARGGAQPSAEETARALSRVLPKASDGQKAMLRAHFLAAECRITATQLAKAAGYRTYSAANLHYGLLGAMLFVEMPQEVPRRKDGSPIMTFVIATGDGQRSGEEEQWVWKMRPHIESGIRHIGGV